MAFGYTRKTLANRWDCSVRHIEELDAKREGPPRIWIAGKWIYPPDGVEAYEQSRTEIQNYSPLNSVD